MRANILLGELEQALGDDVAATEAWKRIESQNPEYLPLVAEGLVAAYRRLGRLEEGLTLLKGYLARYASIDLLNVAFEYLYREPYLVFFPSIVLVLIVLAANFLGDGLRDALDPRQRVEQQ